LRRLQDLDQALALGIDFLYVGSQDVRALQDILAGLDVVGTDGLDNLIIAAVVRVFGSASGAKKAVRGSFELRVAAACGADYSRAVRRKASSVYGQRVVSRVRSDVLYLTMPAIFSANLPTLVPPNLRTTQPPGRCFSSV
jgi:hypothetical protein